ncbi:MAG: hypothetical protein V4487_01245 [Chlamydiota bacterium]
MDKDIQGPAPLGPSEKKMYEQEYKHGADLFKRALDEYKKSDNIYQQKEFKDVMDKAMQVMNETARELMRQELLKQNQQISKDYTAFQDKPTDQTLQNKLGQDLEKAKKSIS